MSNASRIPLAQIRVGGYPAGPIRGLLAELDPFVDRWHLTVVLDHLGIGYVLISV